MIGISIILSFISLIQTDLVYYIISAVLATLVLIGIALMSKVKTAKLGNGLSALSVFIAVIYTMIKYKVFSIDTALYIVLVAILIGVLVGSFLSIKVKMIQMPEMVALLNGVGGAASALVGALSLLTDFNLFEEVTAYIALIIGALTFSGSLIAALKLAKMIDGRPVKIKFHSLFTSGLIVITLLTLILGVFLEWSVLIVIGMLSLTSLLFGYMFSIRVGGADMPITISLLNSLSGVAGAIAGMAVGNVMLVAIGGIVGASGLVLTQIMCRSMNRSLFDILLGKTSVTKTKSVDFIAEEKDTTHKVKEEAFDYSQVKSAIIVPGYGMALAQAQHLVRQLEETLTSKGVDVKYAIHPVAGRMPGHMNVLLAEANVDYDVLYEMHDINDSFKDTDLVVVVGANDVLNPSARDAEGTPIYGMPILNVDQAKHVIICNYDKKPGYAGVENPLYNKTEGVELMLGDAKESLEKLLKLINNKKEEGVVIETQFDYSQVKSAIIVPGYGMALAQAQHLVRQLEETLTSKGVDVKYAIHPVAGRMPGHMNVLLAEANVDYDVLYEMHDINDSFKDTDLVVVVGANDVLNPSARDAEGTPIYGMPILNVDQAKHVIICNYDKKPGYAGVENPLYNKTEGVELMLGDAKESLEKLLKLIK